MLRLLHIAMAVLGFTPQPSRIPHPERLALGGSVTRRRRAGLRG